MNIIKVYRRVWARRPDNKTWKRAKELPADLQYNRVYDVLYNPGRSGKNDFELERRGLNTIRSTDYV